MTSSPDVIIVVWVTCLCCLFVLAGGADRDDENTTTGRSNLSARDHSDAIDFDDMSELSTEKSVTQMLLRRYAKLGTEGRPLRNASNSLLVKFGLGLIQMDLDEANKVLVVGMWTRYQWRDEYLQWDAASYDGLDAVRLQPHQIWKPDIMLYNSADRGVEVRDALVIVRSDGSVLWYPHCVFRSACSIDVSNFPFDHQLCHLWFGSWTYSTAELDLQMAFPEGLDLSTFQSDHKDSSDWEVEKVTAERKVMPSEEEEPNYAILSFELRLARKVSFATFILTMPCVFLACLTLVVFWLPPDRPDRTALAMSCFASLMVLLLILVEAAMPTASSVPTLGVYYCFNMIIIMVAIILSSIVVNMSRLEGQPPRWLIMVVLYGLAKVMCVKERTDKKSPKKAARPNKNTNGECGRMLDDFEAGEKLSAGQHESIRMAGGDELSNAIVGFEQALADVKQGVCRVEHHLAACPGSPSRAPPGHKDWQAIARVLDRLFFLVYLVLISFSLVLLFPRPGTIQPV